MTRHCGRVTWFDKKNGYGFLACGHAADVFADSDQIERRSRRRLKKGDRVLFDLVESEVGPKARSVVRSEAPPHIPFEDVGFVSAPLPVLLPAPVLPLDLWRELRDRAWHFVPDVMPMPRLLGAVRKILRPTHLDAA